MSIFKEDANKYLKGAFLCTAIAAMSLELMTVGGSMIAAIYGPGLARAGPTARCTARSTACSSSTSSPS